MAEPRDVSPEVLRNIYLIRVTVAVAMVAIFWLIYFVALIFKVDLFDFVMFREQPKQLDTETYLKVAVGVSVLTPIVTWWFIRKALYFARYGVVVEAIIRSTGLFKAAGQIDISYEYEFEDRTYTSKASVACLEGHQFARGNPVWILVDPRRPSKSKLFDDVITYRKSDEGDHA